MQIFPLRRVNTTLIMSRGMSQLFLSLCICLLACDKTHSEETDLGVTNQINLLAAIHRLAFPNLITGDVPVTERLVLQIPGYVLKPADYDPGAKYRAAKIDPYDGQPEANIPPYIMENMFRLTDKVLNANPLDRETTGKSFSTAYKNVIYSVHVKKFSEIGESIIKDYNLASATLQASRYDPDSENPRNVTLYELYSRYKMRYFQKKQEVDSILEEKKKSLPSLQYQEWFIKYYPILQAQVEAAYTHWTLYGEKAIVDTFKIDLEVATEGILVDEAREMLRSNGFPALDRSTTVYPVTFTPYNWYQYTIPRKSPLTKDQLSTHIAELESQIVLLETMHSYLDAGTDITEVGEFLEIIAQNLAISRAELEDEAYNLELLRLKCKKQQYQSLKDGAVSQPEDDECVKYRAQEDNVLKSLKVYSSAHSLSQLTIDEYGDQSSTKARIRELIDDLRERIADLRNTLNKAPLYLAGVIPLENTTYQVTEQEKRDGWTYFEFDSTEITSMLDPESDTYRKWFRCGVAEGLWDDKGTIALHGSTSEVSAGIINSHLKVRAKVLKVNINRPWFKEELFHNTNLNLAKNHSVSPGPLPEEDFVSAITTGHYLLPEYTTAFLIVKDLAIDIAGMDSEYSQEAVLKLGSGDFSGSYGPFTIGAAVQYQHETSYTQQSSATGGVSLNVPGAQIIGYHSTLLPKFPID